MGFSESNWELNYSPGEKHRQKFPQCSPKHNAVPTPTLPPTIHPHFRAPNWRVWHTYCKSNLLCTPVHSASKPSVTNSDFSAFDFQWWEQVNAGREKKDKARMPWTCSFRRAGSTAGVGEEVGLKSRLTQCSSRIGWQLDCHVVSGCS